MRLEGEESALGGSRGSLDSNDEQDAPVLREVTTYSTITKLKTVTLLLLETYREISCTIQNKSKTQFFQNNYFQYSKQTRLFSKLF